MKLCSKCPEACNCDKSKYEGRGTCFFCGAQMEIWKPMTEEPPKGRPILVAMTRTDGIGWPFPEVVTLFEDGNYILWPHMIEGRWPADYIVAWCDFTNLIITFS